MPGGDGTGPTGMGPITGGGRGFCGQGVAPRKFFGFEQGQGRGVGGGGRGRRNSFYQARVRGSEKLPFTNQAVSCEEEIGALKDEAAILAQQLESVNKRISELDLVKS